MISLARQGSRYRARLLQWSLMLLLLTFSAGCAVSWISSYDKQSVERTTEISRNSLGLYQQLLEIPAGQRRQAVAGPLHTRYGEVETQIRVHLLQEQARADNADSSSILGNLLDSWQKFSSHHQSGASDALTDATLKAERGVLERHLRAALVAEESKKLGGNAGK